MKLMNSNPWVVKIKPNPGARIKLLCLPFAGGSSVAFRDWANILPDFIELCALEIPGRGQRLAEPLVKKLSDLISQMAEGIKGELDKDFIIFGHSMGAATGFELAHYLINNYSLSPVHLFFSGRGAPHLDNRDEPIHQLSHEDFINKIKSYDGTPKEVLEHSELMDLMVPIIRADFEVCETYHYQERLPLEIPLSVFGGLGDESVNREDLEAWQEHTRLSFNIRMFPGGHFYLHEQKHHLLQSIIRDLTNHIRIQ